MIPAQVFSTLSVARIPSHPFSLFHRMWPVAALGVALIFNVVWIGFHGFELFKLIFSNMGRHAVIFTQERH